MFSIPKVCHGTQKNIALEISPQMSNHTVIKITIYIFFNSSTVLENCVDFYVVIRHFLKQKYFYEHYLIFLLCLYIILYCIIIV